MLVSKDSPKASASGQKLLGAKYQVSVCLPECCWKHLQVFADVVAGKRYDTAFIFFIPRAQRGVATENPAVRTASVRKLNCLGNYSGGVSAEMMIVQLFVRQGLLWFAEGFVKKSIGLIFRYSLVRGGLRTGLA